MNAIGFCIQAVDDRITKLQTLRASLVECVPLMVDTPSLKLYEAEGGKRALENALYQWSAAGRLNKDGDNYTVTAAGKEWFAK